MFAMNLDVPQAYMKKFILLLTLSVGFAFGSFAQSSKIGDFNLGIYGATGKNGIAYSYRIGKYTCYYS